jgi:hypothetical protein
MPTLNPEEFLSYYQRIIDARIGVLKVNIKFLKQAETMRTSNDEVMAVLRSLMLDMLGYNDDVKYYLAKNMEIKLKNSDLPDYIIIFNRLFFENSIKFYQDILALLAEYKSAIEKSQTDKQQNLIDKIVSCMYDGVYTNKLSIFSRHYSSKKNLIKYSIEHNETLPDRLVASMDISNESISELEFQEKLFNFLQDYASDNQKHIIKTFNGFIDKSLEEHTRQDVSDQQARDVTKKLCEEYSDLNLYVIFPMLHVKYILDTLSNKLSNVKHDIEILSVMDPQKYSQLIIAYKLVLFLLNGIIPAATLLNSLDEAFRFKTHFMMFWQKFSEVEKQVTAYKEAEILKNELKIQKKQAELKTVVKKSVAVTAVKDVEKSKIKTKHKDAFISATVVVEATETEQDKLTAQQFTEQLKQQAEAEALKKEQEQLKEAQKLAEIEALNQQASIRRAQERQEKIVLFANKAQSSISETIIQTSSPVLQVSSLFDNLSANNLKRLNDILNTATNDLDLMFTYEQIAAIAEDLGAEIKKGSGSRRKFIFHAFDMDTYEPGRVISSIHNPHGNRHKTGALLGVYVEQFIEKLNNLGINKESLDNYHQLRSERLTY